ncbi:MAG: hypothetical protein JWM56_844 [Candidatus Peribacteria bacterium]|nr:hypothetical protein [Candidatus Peribacteria bacterium]
MKARSILTASEHDFYSFSPLVYAHKVSFINRVGLGHCNGGDDGTGARSGK